MQFSRNKKHFEINVDFFVTNSYDKTGKIS